MIQKSSDILFIAMIFVLICCFVTATSILWIGAVAVCLAFAAALGYHKLQQLSDGMARKAIFACVVLQFIGLLLFGVLLSVEPAWDFGRIYAGALDITTNGSITTTLPYYLESYNNFFITWILSFWFKALSLFHIAPLYAGILLNCLAIESSIVLLIRLTWERYNPQKALFFSVISALFIPLYTYAPVFYTDTLSLPFVSLALFLWHRLQCAITQDKSRVLPLLYSIALGVNAFIGYRVKASVGIIYIAMFLLQLFPLRKKLLLCGCTITLSLLCCIGAYQGALSATRVIDLAQIDDYRLPAEHYVMMGLAGTGGYNPEDHSFSASIPDIAARKQAERDMIIERLQTYGASGYLTFLKSKITYTWLDGTYFAPNKLSIDPLHQTPLHEYFLLTGSYYPLYRTIALLLQLALFLLFAASMRQQDYFFAICRFAIFGLFLFLLIWETRSRYLLNFTPVFLLVATQGAASISLWFTKSNPQKSERNAPTPKTHTSNEREQEPQPLTV